MVVGLVGCGNWGRHILRDLISLGCEVPVVARSRESIARAAEGGAAAIVGDLDSLPSLDAAVVATPTTTHAAVPDEVLERGVPVFCEKPLTDDPEAAEQLAARAPDTLFVMDKWRYHPDVKELDGKLPRVAKELGEDAARVRVGLEPMEIHAAAEHRATMAILPEVRILQAVATLRRPRRRSSAGRALHS